MGTHKSRHNKGRKPLYKEHGSDSARNFVERVEKPADVTIPFRHQPRQNPNPELQAQVARYLAERRAETAIALAAEKKPVFNAHDFLPTIERQSLLDLAIVSDRDLALQLYAERKIRKVELYAARMWQHYFEEYTIQPNISIDASAPMQKQSWQRDGDLSEPQYRALVVRKIATRALGRNRAAFLDRILAPDMGRRDAIRIFKTSGDVIELALKQLLNCLAIFFGHCTGDSEDGLDAFRDASSSLRSYRLAGAESVNSDLRLVSIATQKRLLDEQDAEAHANATMSAM
jgi:hypothetical protein